MKRLMVVLMIAGVLAAFEGVALAQTTPQGTEQTALQGTEQTALQGTEQTAPQHKILDDAGLVETAKDDETLEETANNLDEGQAVAQAAPGGTLDADNLNQQPTSLASISSRFASGQTFTVTRSGELTGVRVLLAKVNSPGDLTVEIAKVDAGSGFPTMPEDVVASTTEPASTFPPGSSSLSSLQPVDIVFDTPASVVASEHYALILKAKGDVFRPDMYIVGSTGDPFLGGGNTYPGGERIFQRCPFGAVTGSGCETPPTEWQTTNGSGGPDLIFGIYIAPPDTTPPEVSETYPSNLATGVPATDNISATFIEEGSGIDTETLTTGFKVVQVKPTGNVQVNGNVTYDEDSQTATFDSSSSLAKGLYRVTLTGVADNAGNVMPDYTWTFATAGPSKR